MAKTKRVAPRHNLSSNAGRGKVGQPAQPHSKRQCSCKIHEYTLRLLYFSLILQNPSESKYLCLEFVAVVTA